MDSTKQHILIVGAGSVGKRHAQNLSGVGCSISCFDPRSDRCDELESLVQVENRFDSLDSALRDNKSGYDGAVICSPPSFHVKQCLALIDQDIPILLEKPVSPDLSGAEQLLNACKHSKVPLLLGYTYRWWEPLKRARELLYDGAIGDVRHITFVMSAHLADWHPWEDYRDFFMASKGLGGGALLDESHWVDIMLWFFGMPQNVFARIDKISSLEIDSDDNVDMIFEYRDGKRVTMHLDLYGRPHEKYIKFVGEEGTLTWTVDPNKIETSKSANGDWESEEFQCERNDMFMAVGKEFLKCIGGAPVDTCHIGDGVNVLKVIDAARRSSMLQQIVQI